MELKILKSQNLKKYFLRKSTNLKGDTMNNEVSQNRKRLWLFLILFFGLFTTLCFAGDQTDVLGLGKVYETIEQWTGNRNLNLLITTIIVVAGLVRWWQIGGMAGRVQFASLFILAVIFYNSNKIATALYAGVF